MKSFSPIKIIVFFYGFVWLFSSAGVSAVACEAASPRQTFVTENYPNGLTFDVFRNGKLVGEHVTRFEQQGTDLSVVSRMALTIKVLFLTVYEFEYLSETQWCESGLNSMRASTNRNGEETVVTASVANGAVQIRSPLGEFAAPLNIMTTDHWNPEVIGRQEVLNTITGSVNQVNIARCAQGTELIEKASPGAMCYEYSGDLTTRVWYDDAGRWRGLEFKGDDGSTINYVCKQCE
ncbi:MAG: DUF6134 family protein [Pseudomonadota bacterium]